jgi:hypothetical protein
MDEIEVNALCDELGMFVNRGPARDRDTLGRVKEMLAGSNEPRLTAM